MKKMAAALLIVSVFGVGFHTVPAFASSLTEVMRKVEKLAKLLQDNGTQLKASDVDRIDKK